MSLWDWIRAYRAEALASNNPERLRLLSLYDAALSRVETDPQKGLDQLVEARSLAVHLREPWWPLKIDHWRLQLLLHYLGDVSAALDLAVRATLEVRKPEFDHFPQRVCLHEDLIFAYLSTDPRGYADLIGQALEFMRAQAGEDLDCRYCLQNCTTIWLMRCDRLDEAERSARLNLQMADEGSEAHHASAAQSDLCELAHLRNDWDGLRGHAEAGEEAARRANRAGAVSEFLLWRAVAARRANEEDQAGRLMRMAVARAARLRALPSPAFYDALSTFYAAGGDLNAAMAVRTRELETIAGKGRLFQECRAHVRRCRLLVQIGLPLTAALTAAHEAARKLRDPSPYLEELARIEVGG